MTAFPGAAVFAAAAVLLLAAPAKAEDSTQAAPEASAGATPAMPPVADVFSARRELQDFLISVSDLKTDAFLAQQAELAARLENEVTRIRTLIAPEALKDASVEQLVDLRTELRAEGDTLKALADDLVSRSNRRDRELDKLGEYRSEWQDIIASAREREAPAEVMELAGSALPEIDDAEARLKADRNAALAGLSEITRIQMTVASFEARLRSRTQALEAEAQQAAGAPVWDSDFWGHPLFSGAALRELQRAALALVAYLQEHGLRIFLWLVGIFGVIYWLLDATGRRVEEYLEKDDIGLKSAAIFRRPGSAALLAALMGVYWLAPPGPVVFDRVIWALLPLPAAALAVSVFGKPIRLSLYTLALALVILQLQPLLDGLPVLDRAFTAFQLLSIAIAFGLDLRRGNWARAFPKMPPGRLRILVQVVCVSVIAILLLDLVGLVGPARTLKELVLGGLALGMIFVSASYVLTGLVIAMLHVRPFSNMTVVKNRRWAIVGSLKRAIRLFLGAAWLFTTLQASGLLETVVQWVESLLSTELSLGAISVSVSALVSGVLVIVATVLITRLVRFIFDSRSLDGASMAAGVSFAISKVLRYGIAVAGFIFALAVMGFDITKVTVLAGALGVGIGFGLQNIVNNFVSGLILLFERPIKINDITKVDEFMGTVREMGIRSTLIETFDGAEVIVPNADFVSKSVLNWTRSNRRRRAEIDVGVAYGSDAGQVLDILERVASEQEDVTRDPKPFAVFTGFGDSALNFRLYVWFEDLSNVLVSASQVRQRMLDAFAAAGITIPFPQRDVRIISTAAPGTAPGVTPASGISGTQDPSP
ncbi:MAG: mechanosensitive ion channel [Gammaproteobacteria bacterium]